ncbi:AAA family ATPase, partial [bacterium]|nr:AAA family ATPase [bacterium]
MLKKIGHLSNVGRFERCEPHNGLILDQFTIIYGDNGRGKTTLSAIMRSLKTGEARYILERCTLDAQGQPREPKVILETDQGRTIYENGSWLKLFPNIEIFDSCFTNENIFSGDRIEPDHRKSLYPLIIGEQGVQLAKDFSELGIAVKNKNEEIKEKAVEIQQYTSYGIPIANFIALPQVDNIDEAIDGASKRVRALQQEKEIETRAELNKVDFPDITIDALEAMLAKSLADVFRDAQTLTHKHIDHCQMGDRGQGWLKEGLSYVQSESCPFCGQSLVGNDLLVAYE